MLLSVLGCVLRVTVHPKRSTDQLLPPNSMSWSEHRRSITPLPDPLRRDSRRNGISSAFPHIPERARYVDRVVSVSYNSSTKLSYLSGDLVLMSGQTLQLYWREIVAIIEGGLKPDPYRVSSFAEHFADRLEAEGEARLASRIRRLTEHAAKPAGSTFVTQTMSADVESQQSLVEEVRPGPFPKYPVLPPSIETELKRFVELNRLWGDLASAGIEPPCTLLLFGPPGCGKTMSAAAVACDLGLPLWVVRLDSLLGSFLGNSGEKPQAGI